MKITKLYLHYAEIYFIIIMTKSLKVYHSALKLAAGFFGSPKTAAKWHQKAEVGINK